MPSPLLADAWSWRCPYESSVDTDFPRCAQDTCWLAGPDGLFFISGAPRRGPVLRSRARRLAPTPAPWQRPSGAATEQLPELGGQMVEGLVIVQNYDKDDESPRFRLFREAYFKRFQKNPGYSAVSAYDAATVLLDALARRRDGESVKAARCSSTAPTRGCSSRSPLTPTVTPPARCSLPRSMKGASSVFVDARQASCA